VSASIPDGSRSAGPAAAGLPDVLGVLADVLTAATHPDAEVARERDRLVERITMARAQPRTIAREALQRKRFGTHPITRELPTAAEVAEVDAAQVRALQAASLVPGGSILTLVGDLDPAAALAEVEKQLAGWTADHAARELTPPPPITASDLELVHRPGSVQSQLRLTAPGVGCATCYAALQLANLVFGGHFSSRWMENIREDKGYTTARTRASSSCPAAGAGPGDRRGQRRHRRRSLETRTSWAASSPCHRRGRGGRGTGVRDRVAGDLAGQPGGLASSISALAADDLTLDWLGGHPAPRGRHGRGDRGRGAALLRPDGGHRRDRRRRGRDRPGVRRWAVWHDVPVDDACA
jgi:hypothetical protein